MHEVGSEQAETVAAVKAKFEHFAKMRGEETTGSLSLQIYTGTQDRGLFPLKFRAS